MAPAVRHTLNALDITTDQMEYFRSDSHCQEIIRRLQAREDLLDVVFIVGRSQKRIAAHSLVLIGSSDYFSALFTQPMDKTTQREITVNDMDENGFEELINYCYTGILTLRGDMIENLLYTAIHLRLDKVIQACCEFLQRHVRPGNYLGVAFLAKQLNLEPLFQNSQRLIYENFEEVSNLPDFFLLTANQLNDFLVTDELYVSSEEMVFEILMKWIDFEPEYRRQYFKDLLPLVRLPLVSPHFLLTKVEPHCKETKTLKLVTNALRSLLLVTCNSVQPRNYVPRNVVQNILAIYASDDTLLIAMYNLHSRDWTICNTPIRCRRYSALTLMDDKLVTVGVDTTILNMQTMVITEMPSVTTGGCGQRVVVLKGTIYVIGGYDEHRILNTVGKWDNATQSWKSVAPMDEGRTFSGVAVFNDYVYVSGGLGILNDNVASMASVERYDTVENIWISVEPMGTGRSSHCLVVYKGCLYAIGGFCHLNDEIPVERYDPRTDTWTTIPCSHDISGRTAAASVGSDVFIYNNSSLYMINSASNWERLELDTVADDTIDMLLRYGEYPDLVAIPYEFNPPETWIET